MAHGFYVAMGGFALVLPPDLPESEQFVPSWACGTWFITQPALAILLNMDRDRLPSLTEEEIKSKSKANGLAKALATKKKLSEDFPEKEHNLFTSRNSVAIFKTLPGSFCLLFQHSPQRFSLVQDPFKTPARQPDTNGIPASTKFMPGEVIPNTGIELQSMLKLGWFHPALPSLNLTRQDINRWVMAKRAAELIHALKNSDRDIFDSKPFRRRCTDMPDFDDVLDELPLALGFSAAAMVYGGLHALAWFANFHSPTEQLLWRLSSVAVMGGIPTLATINIIYDHLEQTFYTRYDKVVEGSIFVLFFPVAIAYILARLYLVIECFIQLSHLPAGVYEVPEWSSYFPHIA
ncbi:MAG: hypothetical protein L6R42_001437 [Xanthoria sp. 1 TBL-2021]|nr:MAG: hypothetical protein L6R42_001437 [Xanthoria sp. 1 TBL-2021]